MVEFDTEINCVSLEFVIFKARKKMLEAFSKRIFQMKRFQCELLVPISVFNFLNYSYLLCSDVTT